MELLDVYNSNGEITGKIVPRGSSDDAFGPDEHIGVAIIYIENSKGEFLMQLTSKEKGSIYSATGGHIDHGETPYETIIREVKEEIGLDISNENVIDLGHICVDFPVRFIFYLKKDININDLVLDKKEVESMHYLTKEELRKAIDEGKMHKGHIFVLEEVLKYKEKIGD